MAKTAEQVREIFRRHADEILEAREVVKARLFAVYVHSTQDLLEKLSVVGARADAFTPVLYANMLGQLREAIVALYSDAVGALSEDALRAADMAQRHLAEKLAALSEHFDGSIRQISSKPIGKLLELVPYEGVKVSEVLQETRQASSAALSADMLARARVSMAASLASNAPMFGFDSATARLRKALGVPESRAELIARTEHSRAYNLVHHADLAEANRNGGNYEKTLVLVRDSRTHWDSYGAAAYLAERGGSIPLEELFVDGAGRRYLTPPGRPNDREVEVPWKRVWGGMDQLLALAA